MRRVVPILRAVALASLVVALLAGCSGSNGESSIPADGDGQEVVTTSADVRIQNFSFDPGTVRVKVGGTVTWTNEDKADHDVTGDGWQSESMATGDTYRNTFEAAGTYSYLCGRHPSMQGTVIVEE